MEVLAKGLNFAVTPDHIPVIDMITATESAIRNNNIPEEEAEQLRAQVSMSLLKAKPPPPNLSEQEKRALTSLSKDINVTILPADKGRCTVVLNADDYHSRVTALLSDYNTYEILNRDPTSKYKKQVIKCLQLLEKQGVIDRKLYYRLYPGDTTPCLYGLPKGDETMVSYDVISLFTCVPTVLAVETVRSRLSHDPMLRQRTQLNPDQKHGCAMGSPVSPIVANLYMEEVEKKALETYSGTLPTHWFRYVDDTWVKIKINEIGPFTDHINSVDDYIKFTKEEMREKQLPFLDCGMYLENEGDLQVEVYRKPTHTDQYLMFDSHHPLEHKLGVIRTLQHRAGTIPTNQEARIKEQKHIEKALKQCHYPKWAFIKAQKNKPNDPKSGNIKIKRPRRSHVVIPYVAGLSEKFRRVFSKHNIPVYFKPKNTLRQMLVHPKDQVPKHQKCNLVYAVKCTEECKDLYIGETKQMLSKRTTYSQPCAVHKRTCLGCIEFPLEIMMEREEEVCEVDNVNTALHFIFNASKSRDTLAFI
ncbi:reverse transcriptase [Labeo rohita]|uniref:Reverse transcriptase n=1 Tax=Labeo rohita TaxID=84645 RepID=A0A498NV10_LABRO|nr:reverse transcriptase [Labeo rohita]